MNARPGHPYTPAWLRAMFAHRQEMFGGVLLMATFAAMLAWSPRLGDIAFTLKSLTFTAAWWWLLMGLRFCTALDSLVRMRAPGQIRFFARGIAVHGLLSIALPLLIIAFTPGAPDLATSAKALWLGSGLGLLVLSVPVTGLSLPAAGFVTLVWLDSAWLFDGAASSLAGAGSVALAVLSWYQHSRTPLVAWRRPTGVVMDDAWRNGENDAGWWGTKSRTSGERILHAADQRVALVLGRDGQTLRQAYGTRGQRVGYLVILAAAALLVWLDVMAYDVYSAALCVMVLNAAAIYPFPLAKRLYLPARAAIRAELKLLPGLPQHAFIRQLVAGQIERLGVALVIVAAYSASALQTNAAWGLSLVGMTATIQIWMAWLALRTWTDGANLWRDVPVTVLAPVFSIATGVQILHPRLSLPDSWIVAWTICVVIGAGLLAHAWRALPGHTALAHS